MKLLNDAIQKTSTIQKNDTKKCTIHKEINIINS